jgi:uncharacterized protein YhdP
MIDNDDIKRLDNIYVRKDDCNNIQLDVDRKLANDSTRFAVLEYQQKLNNWLTGAICGGIIALLIKVYLGG